MSTEMTEAEAQSTIDQYVASMHRVSLIVHRLGSRVRAKPLVGGSFGHGGFVMLSYWCVLDGIDRVDYFIADAATRFVFGWGDTKPEALGAGRACLLNMLSPGRLRSECAKHAEACEQAGREAAERQQEARRIREEEYQASAPSKVRSMPKRRKRIFDESHGKCHYCETPLTLDGKWHIEHKMPKALGGGNEPSNLVASCVPCNHKKRDTTDLEFKARIGKGKSA